MSIFGNWHSRFTRNQSIVPVPVGQECLFCSVEIREYDTGQMTIVLGGGSKEKPCHRGCLLLPLLGHEAGICHCTRFDDALSPYHAGLKLELALGEIQYPTMMQRLALGTSNSQSRERPFTMKSLHRA